MHMIVFKTKIDRFGGGGFAKKIELKGILGIPGLLKFENRSPTLYPLCQYFIANNWISIFAVFLLRILFSAIQR